MYNANQLFNFIQGSDISGESAYDLWKRLGNTGTEADFLEYIRSGPKGEKGDPAHFYGISVSDNVIKKDANDVLVPANITFSGYYRIGNEITRYEYAGKFVIQETTDGEVWRTKYESTVNELSKTYSPSSTNVTLIKCILYSSVDEDAIELDVQSVAILSDGSGSGGSGAEAESPLVAILSNEAHVIATDSQGNGGSFVDCNTSIQVFKGLSDVTDVATYEVNACEGVTGSWDLVTFTYTVTDLSIDVGYVDITASYEGVSVTKRFSISKAKEGRSAYELWLAQGNEGTEQEFLESVVNIPLNEAITTTKTEVNEYTDTQVNELKTYVDESDNSIREELNALQDISNQIIIDTTESTMPNSYDSKLHINEIGGVCEQLTPTGKNIYPNGDISISSANSYKGYQFISLNAKEDWEVGKTYTVSFFTDTAFKYTVLKANAMSDLQASKGVRNSITFTVTYSTSASVIMFAQALNVNVKITDIMVEESSEVTAYEPYTGGLPAPSPSYPQEIKKSIINEIRTHKKNFLRYPYYHTTRSVNGIDFTDNGDGTITVNGTATAETTFYCKPRVPNIYNFEPGEYILSGCPDGGSTSTYSLVINKTVGAGNSILSRDYGSGAECVISQDDAPHSAFILVANGAVLENVVFRPMLRRADISDAAFECYTESSITLSEPIELYGIGDVQDVIEDGKVRRRFAKVILNGTETYRYYNKAVACNVVDSLVKPSDSNYVTPNILSERFVSDTPSNVLNGVNENRITVAISADTSRLRLHSDIFTSAEDAVSYFSANPTEIIYELAEEITEDLPIVDQIALNSLETFEGVTYLEFDSEVKPTFSVAYATDNIGGYILEALSKTGGSTGPVVYEDEDIDFSTEY